ncbi:hypothetical protein [Bacillus sp. SM2101]|nr:hypothetical protein [Bacillus sp. SM2101]
MLELTVRLIMVISFGVGAILIALFPLLKKRINFLHGLVWFLELWYGYFY